MASVSNLTSNISNLKILIRLPNWLGDVVMSTAFINAVTVFYPDALVDVIIKKELEGIASLIPGINKIHLFAKQEYNGLTGVYRFGKNLRAAQYDVYFNLPHSLSSAVMAWASGARRRVGFNKEGGLFLLTHTYSAPKELHRVDQYLHLMERYTGRSITGREVKIDIYLENHPDSNMLLINFNSEAISRRMPEDKARKLLSAISGAFPDVQFGLIGSAKEKNYVDALIPANNISADGYPIFINYAGNTTLSQLAGHMAYCRAVLTTDSGPAHLANSLGVPTVVLFGAGDENSTAPYNKNHLTVLRYGHLVCEPCIRNTCKLYGIPKCMEMLDEIKIIKALSLYLKHA